MARRDPRFIKTVARRGYRFIAAVERVEPLPAPVEPRRRIARRGTLLAARAETPQYES